MFPPKPEPDVTSSCLVDQVESREGSPRIHLVCGHTQPDPLARVAWVKRVGPEDCVVPAQVAFRYSLTGPWHPVTRDDGAVVAGLE